MCVLLSPDWPGYSHLQLREQGQIRLGESYLQHHDAIYPLAKVFRYGRPWLGLWRSCGPQPGRYKLELVLLTRTRSEDLLFDRVVLRR